MLLAIHGHDRKAGTWRVEHIRAPRAGSVRRIDPVRRMTVRMDMSDLTPVKYYTDVEGRREFDEPRTFIAHLREAKHILLEDDSLAPLLEHYRLESENVSFCRHCFLAGRATVLNESDIHWESERLCLDCAEHEMKHEFRSWFGRDVDSDLKPFIKKAGELDAAMKLFDPRIDPLTTPEKSLHSVVKPKEDAVRCLQVGGLPIPAGMKATLKKVGVKELTPVQSLAIKAGLLDGKDLLVVSATASGKTLVGELAGVTRALEGRRLLFLVPLVALANQKYHEFTERYGPLGLTVSLRVGFSRLESVTGVNRDHAADIVVGTYEGMDHLMRCGTRPDDVGCVVIDEVHMLGSDERGPRLDGFLARLRTFYPDAQFVGLSASVGNPRRLAESLGTELVEHAGRPVALERHLVIVRDANDKQRQLERYCSREWNMRAKGGVRGQSLVFTNARRKAEEQARTLTKAGIPSMAYHSGLTYAKRKVVEREFMSRKIGAVVSTAALGAGIDFPASQVVFESLAMGIEWLTVQEFQQMAGRAGRPTYHSRGLAVVLAEVGRGIHPAIGGTEESMAFRLMEGTLEPVDVEYSKDADDEQVLATMVCGVPADDVDDLLRRAVGFDADVDPIIEGLVRAGLVADGRPTPLGEVASRHFLTLEQVNLMVDTIGKEAEEFVERARPFDRAYLGRGLSRTIEGILGIRAPQRFFDGRFLDIYQRNRDQLEARMGRYVRMVTKAFFSCHCRGRPFCGCPERRFTAYLLTLRRRGLDPRAMTKQAQKDYWLKLYSGDVIRWLDDVIRWLEAREAVARILGEEKVGRETRDLCKKLQGRV